MVQTYIFIWNLRRLMERRDTTNTGHKYRSRLTLHDWQYTHKWGDQPSMSVRASSDRMGPNMNKLA